MLHNLFSFWFQALESVEEALIKLEDLLQALYLSKSNPGKEQLKAVCSDLERIRKLKKEAEFLEASFKAKAASLEQVSGSSCSGLNIWIQLISHYCY